MLVLKRRAGERILIEGGIIISIESVGSGGRVAVGIVAPKHLKVDREEIADLRGTGYHPTDYAVPTVSVSP